MPSGIYKHNPLKDEHKRNIGKAHLGKKHSKETLKKLSGKNAHKWAGNNVGYHGIHLWVNKWKGKPTTCEGCGKPGLTGQRIHWANVDHKYRRILDDYIRLCVKCHKEYDKINNK